MKTHPKKLHLFRFLLGPRRQRSRRCVQEIQDYTDWAINNQFIASDNHYLPGKRCRHYWFLPPFDTCKWEQVWITDPYIVKHLTLHRKKQDKEREKLAEKLAAERATTSAVYDYLWGWVQRVELRDIDYDWLETLRIHKKGELQTFNSVHQRQIDAVAASDYHWSIDDNGRFYSNFTNLWTPIRKFMWCEGEFMVETDIKNSQPLFLALYVLDYLGIDMGENAFWGIFSFSPSLFPILPSSSFISSQSLLPSTLPYDTQKGTFPDVLNFLKAVESGQLYEILQAATNLEHLKRPVFKYDVFFPMLYGRNKYNFKRDDAKEMEFQVFNAMRRLYPNVVKVMTTEKSRPHEGHEKKSEWHSWISNEMQRMESKFLINTVAVRLMEQHPEVPIVTIHDSILTTPEFKPLVESVIREEFVVLGLNPQLH